MGIDLEDVKRVIMTHSHLDHIGCLSEILKQIPWAEMWIHTEEADPLEKGDERTVYGMDMFKTLCQTQYGIKPGAFRLQANRKLKDGEVPQLLAGWSGKCCTSPDTRWGALPYITGPREYSSRETSCMPIMRIGRFDLHGANAARPQEVLIASCRFGC